MAGCNFEKLVRYLDKELDLDGKLDILGHLDSCEICRDAMYHIARDRDARFFTSVPLKQERKLAS